MDAGQPAEHAIREALQRILASPGFARNERLSRFLRFIVEGCLEGRHGELKESVIGLQVFDRHAGYDPQQDAIVRTEAVRLRARLAAYYAGPGGADPLIIDVPKGGYAPRFTPREGAGVPAPPVPERRRSRAVWTLAAAVAFALLTGLSWQRYSAERAPIGIAVLPLENLSRDPNSDYFAEGLSDELIRKLSVIDGLSVRSRTSSFSFKGQPRNIREVARQLSVEYALEGSILRANQDVRINVQLVRVLDDVPVWSGRFDRKLTDIFAVQDEISLGIVNSLRLKLGRGRRRYETSVEAYDLYLRARADEFHVGMPGYQTSPGKFDEAVAKDPAFAPAYAAIAEACAVRSGWFGKSPAEEAARMRAAAAKAIQLDPLLPEAHASMGMALARDARWDDAERSFRRAIELAPSRSDTYRHFATFAFLPRARLEEALRYLRIAASTDPLSPEVHFNLAYVLAPLHRYDEAAKACERLPRDFWARRECIARVRLGQGRVNDAIDVLAPAFQETVLPGSEMRGFLGYAYARAGRTDEAQQLAAASPQNPFNQAEIFAGLGDTVRMSDALARAADVGPVRTGWSLQYPGLAERRDEQSIKTLRRQVGLPD